MKKECMKYPKYCTKMIWKEWKQYKGIKMMKEMMEASKKAPNWRSVQWPDETYSKIKSLWNPMKFLKRFMIELMPGNTENPWIQNVKSIYNGSVLL